MVAVDEAPGAPIHAGRTRQIRGIARDVVAAQRATAWAPKLTPTRSVQFGWARRASSSAAMTHSMSPVRSSTHTLDRGAPRRARAAAPVEPAPWTITAVTVAVWPTVAGTLLESPGRVDWGVVEEARVGRWWSSWTRSQDEVEAGELATQAHEQGALAIAACQRGQSVCVHGTIRSVTLRPRAKAPTLEAEVYDGSGLITLVWIGHRRLSGVDVGRPITARGRVTCPAGEPTIFNPSYRLFPEPAESTA